MGNPFDDLFKNARTFEINGPGGLRVKTNGTREDNDAAVRALEALRVAWPPGVAERLGQPQKAAREAVAPSVKLGGAVKAWKAAIKSETLKKTFTQKACAVDAFAAHYGADKPVSDIGRVDIGNWLDALRVGGLATPTLANKASYLRGFCDYAKSRGWLTFDGDGNPAEGQVSYSKSAKRLRRSAGFHPFDSPQIAKLFDPAALTNMGLAQRWGALIGLYTGARVAEVGQLALVDIIAPGGVPSFNITDNGKGQSLKNTASKRTIPIHPDLIALGLLDRVKRLRNAGEKQLFPKVKIGGVNGMGNWLSKAFTAHIRRLSLSAPKGKFGFHSLRKTYNHALQDLGVNAAERAALLGHNLPGVHFSVYSKPPTPAQLLQAVKPLSFGLDLKAIKRVLEK